DWPFWRDGGMRIDPASQQAMQETTGLQAMPSSAGINAFYLCLATGQPRLLVLHGDTVQMRAWLAGAMAAPTVAAVSAPAEPATNRRPGAVADGTQAAIVARREDDGWLRRRVARRLQQLVAEITGALLERVQESEPMEAYGLDSIA